MSYNEKELAKLFDAPWDDALKWVSSAVKKVKEVASTAIETVKGWGSSAASTVKSGVSAAIEGVKGAFSTGASAAKALLDKAIDKAKDVVDETTKMVEETVKPTTRSIFDYTTTKLVEAKEKGEDAITDLVQKLLDLISDAKDSAEGAKDLATSFFGSTMEKAKDLLPDPTELLLLGLNSIFLDFASFIWDSLAKALEPTEEK